MEISFIKSIEKCKTCLIIGINEKLKIGEYFSEFNEKYGGIITSMLNFANFKGKAGDICQSIVMIDKEPLNLVLVGIGKELIKKDAVNFGGKLFGLIRSLNVKEANFIFDESVKNNSEIAAEIAYGALLKSYKFKKYKTKKDKDSKVEFKNFNIYSDDQNESKKIFKKFEAIAKGVFFTKELVSEPPNVIYPETFAQECLNQLEKIGVEVEILDQKEMKDLGMGALLGVAQGSIKEPKLVVMKYQGSSKSKNKKPIAFIGKGVTFDSGGISLKPSPGMEDMKYDMAGAGVVCGLIKALALRKAKVNVVGVIGLVENMPSGTAQRPSDVIHTMSGQTVEVLNTDAEGRLVLADALWYCQNRFKPEFMINLATLTGAIVVTFGSVFAGLFSNNDNLADKLIKSAEKTEERLWRMPLDKIYDKQINSEIADMQNISLERGAGSITAAQFLQRFVNNVPWAHLDIAGVAWSKKDNQISSKGATGFGVRLLNQLVEDYFEEK